MFVSDDVKFQLHPVIENMKFLFFYDVYFFAFPLYFIAIIEQKNLPPATTLCVS